MIVVLTIMVFALFLVLYEKVFPYSSAILNQFFYIITRSPNSLLSMPPDFYTLLFLTIFLALLFVFISNAVIRLVFSLAKTKIYLNSLQIIKNGKYAVFKARGMEAFSAGIFTPKTYISSSMYKKLSKKELRAVLLHEEMHRRDHDPLQKIIVEFCTNILGLPPLQKFFTNSFALLCELTADAYAQQKLGSRVPIVKAIAAVITLGRNNLALNYFANTPGRIEVLTDNKNFSAIRLMLLLVFSITTIGISTGYMLNSNLVNICKIPYYI